MKNNSIWGGYFSKDSRILKGSVLVAIAAIFSIGGFFVSHANAQLTLLPAFLWIVFSKFQMQVVQLRSRIILLIMVGDGSFMLPSRILTRIMKHF